ncbi:P-loop containing nucleoside triphosphate hydrolase protein [Dioscorea alata]|uniref:P-loop containing nucleoside triphosphate hydrolase protein n=1 Tax=Dioscorea alata TaxID=55571 RepID=A0ACB7VJA5_DIOAL|nr:P-loop containing nucleoside triphosphate hydrolase protein [Dioscorea alata]
MSNPAISFVIQKLTNLLVEEAVLLFGVRDQVNWVLVELKRMQCFLKDADSRQRKGDELAKNWVREVRDVAFDAEDVIDTYLLKVERLRQKKGLLVFVKRYSCFSSELKARHKIGAKINRLRIKIQDISDSRARYGILNIGESGESRIDFIDENLQARRNLSPYLNDDTTVVGFHHDMEVLLNQLTDARNLRRSVLSIAGMGGLGKTTLAKKIYSNDVIKQHFDVCVWVTISQVYIVTDLLKIIISRVVGLRRDELEGLDESGLKEKLLNSLNGRRYLIVMDDVWDKNVWTRIKGAFPNDVNGSRVLITTRVIEVASFADPITIPYELSFLPEDSSWELFLLKAFPTRLDSHVSCPEDLEDIGLQLVKRCGGLPLALVVLGGLLSRKDPDPAVWSEVAERMDWNSTHDGQECLKILALSYCDLPHHYLKSCFLYLAAFPEDSEILTSKLIKLWAAEGFIPERERQTVEEIGWGYLDELVQRCMVQVVKVRDYDKSVKKIRIHDVLHEFCIAEAREVGLINASSTYSAMTVAQVTSRRLALQNYRSSDCCFTGLKLRTLLLFNSSVPIMNPLVLHGLKLLRVIDLEGAGSVVNLPKEIERMIYLRYMGLRNCTSLHRLPPTIGNLCSLRVLDARNTSIVKLPEEVCNIQTLRIINMEWFCSLPSNICNLNCLQILKHACAAGGWVERCSREMINLQVLGISALASSQLPTLCHLLGNLTRLISLKLELHGMLHKLPDHHLFPQNLSKLTLRASMLEDDPMPVLEKLRNLIVLRLMKGTYAGKEMVCSAGGFPRLRVLEISCLEYLECWRIEDCSMANLLYLSISVCRKLSMLPEGLQRASSLQELKLSRMPEDFNARAREGGEDWHKISHLHSITIY